VAAPAAAASWRRRERRGAGGSGSTGSGAANFTSGGCQGRLKHCRSLGDREQRRRCAGLQDRARCGLAFRLGGGFGLQRCCSFCLHVNRCEPLGRRLHEPAKKRDYTAHARKQHFLVSQRCVFYVGLGCGITSGSIVSWLSPWTLNPVTAVRICLGPSLFSSEWPEFPVKVMALTSCQVNGLRFLLNAEGL